MELSLSSQKKRRKEVNERAKKYHEKKRQMSAQISADGANRITRRDYKQKFIKVPQPFPKKGKRRELNKDIL